MWNIVIGILMIIAGLSGKFALIGTNSSRSLAIFGAVVLVWGIVQIVRGRR